MARFYAHYQNTTQSSLENLGYNKRTVSTTPAGTARTNMLSTRQTLSDSFYSTIDNANKNGNLGIVVPYDAYTNNGTTISGNNLYTETTPSPGAVWQSDPSIRPSNYFAIAGTESTIADNFSVPTAQHTACVTEIYNYLNSIYTDGSLTVAGGPAARPGGVPERTYLSLHHDHAMTYFAWDDFTPGQPTISMDIAGLNPSGSPYPDIYPGGNPVNTDITITLELTAFEYLNDGNGLVGINMTVADSTGVAIRTLALNNGANGGPISITSNSNGTGPTNPRQGGNSTWSWNSSSKTLSWTIGLDAGVYRLTNVNATLYDGIITTNAGAQAVDQTIEGTSTDFFEIKSGEPA